MKPMLGNGVLVPKPGDIPIRRLAGMSGEAYNEAIHYVAMWEVFRDMRRGGKFFLMLEYEIMAHADGDRLTALLRQEGFGDDKITEYIDHLRLVDGYHHVAD